VTCGSLRAFGCGTEALRDACRWLESSISIAGERQDKSLSGTFSSAFGRLETAAVVFWLDNCCKIPITLKTPQ